MNHREPLPLRVCAASFGPIFLIVCALTAGLSLVLTGFGETSNNPPLVKLETWERGIAVTSPYQEDMTVFLWFYEWNMFDALQKGQHTHGTSENEINVSQDQRSGSVVSSPLGLSLEMQAGVDSADMTLTVTNESDHDWPELASIIPCFNPAPVGSTAVQIS